MNTNDPNYSRPVPQVPPNLPARHVPQGTEQNVGAYIDQPVYQHGMEAPPAQDSGYNPANYAGQSAYQSGQAPPFQAQQLQHDPTQQGNQSSYPSTSLPPPPQRIKQTFPEDDDPANPIHYVRDPTRLIAYLVPFPKPTYGTTGPTEVPSRFMIWTPPPPPLQKPAEGEKEGKLHKVQRKWQEEIRSAKTSTAKTASWKGVKSKATKGISWAVDRTTNSNLDFLGRVDPMNSDSEHEPGNPSTTTTKKTVPVSEMLLIYPPAIPLNNEQMREEFVNTMLRTKSKAQRDTVIATGLMPVAFGIDILATLVWPFGGLGEIDTVWAASSFRGAKTARSVTKRLSSAFETENPHDDAANDNQLMLNFVHSQRIEVLTRYLEAECHKADAKLFPSYHTSPTESNVLEAVGWSPSSVGGETKNWEDEQWEMSEVKDDIKLTFSKAAKEWKKWCLLLEKNPEKAAKK